MKLAQVLVLRDSRILLGKWKHGDFAGRYTGLIGKVDKETGSSPEAAARHWANLLVGAQLDLSRIERRAKFRFEEVGPKIPAYGQSTLEYQMVYKCDAKDTWVPKTSEYMEPEWFDVTDIPFQQMPADDELWYNSVLQGDYLTGTFSFNGLELINANIKKTSFADLV